jgi:uncharacterized protein (DUF58 family)/transglutaminase-like putative cysteine protease
VKVAAGPAALTARGRAALVCGIAAIAYGRLFGTAEVALLGAALAGAAVAARIWVGLAGGPHVAVRSLPAFAHAGERVRVEVELRPLEGARPGRAVFAEAGGGQTCALRPVAAGGLRVLRGTYELGPLERGVRELAAGTLVREDPFGLARRAELTRGGTSLTVLAPPLELQDRELAGSAVGALRRQRLRGGGHELHGVREHQPGESLRGVHWPATAHHGRLMVKDLDDPAEDDLAVVLDARASGDFGVAPDSSFELAAAAAGALVERAFADSRRVRLIVAGGDGDLATATERTAVRKLLARVRPAGERPPGELLDRLAAERVEVVTSRPGALVGAARTRRLGVIAIDPSSFDATVPRDADALATLRAAGARVVELRRRVREPESRRDARAVRGLSLRSALYALAAGFGLLHARDLQIPAVSTPRLLALAALATAPALMAAALRARSARAGSERGRGRSAAWALVPAGIGAAWISAGSPPSWRWPLGGLAGQLADAPASWVQVVLPFARGEYPELRALVLVASFAWLAALAWLWLARPRPLAAALLALLPFAVSATVYDLPQYPLRALVAGTLLFAFLVARRASGCGPALAAASAALALATGVGWAAVPAASQPAVLPWTTWTFTHADDQPAAGLVWDMSYHPLVFLQKPVELLQVRASRPSYWRAVVLPDFDGLRFTRPPQAIADTREDGGVLLIRPAPPGARVRAEVRATTLVESLLVGPGRPVRFELPRGAGPVDLSEDGTAQLLIAPSAGLEYRAEGVAANPTAGELRSLAAVYPTAVSGRALRFAGEAMPPFGSAGRVRAMEALFRRHRGDPVWRAWQAAYARARSVTRGAASPYQAVVALEAWLRTSRAYDEHVGLPATPDALARWAASGEAGYCQMFAASLAALARLSGVPARIAEGFVPGERRDGVFRVTDRDAHAWVEAWFPGYGWLPFDPTPGRSLPARASSSSSSFDGQAASARTPVAGQTGTLPRLQLPLGRLRAASAGAANGSGGAWWDTSAALLIACLVAVPAGLLPAKRLLLRRLLPRDPAGAARRRVRSFAADQGLELNPALTPRELAAALERRFGVPADGFAAALERSAYAPGARDAAGVRAETDRLLAALRGALGRRRRLRGALSLSGVRDRAR